MMKSKKIKELKFDTVKETLGNYRDVTIAAIRNAFWSQNFDLKEVMMEFLSFCEKSEHYSRMMTLIHEPAAMQRCINNAVSAYRETTNFSTNYDAVNAFEEECAKAAMNSKSF